MDHHRDQWQVTTSLKTVVGLLALGGLPAAIFAPFALTRFVPREGQWPRLHEIERNYTKVAMFIVSCSAASFMIWSWQLISAFRSNRLRERERAKRQPPFCFTS